MSEKEDSQRNFGIDFESKDYPIRKAGFFIYGNAVNPKTGRMERYVIAPYSEGRFSNGVKHFALPKGSVDPIKEIDPTTGQSRTKKVLNPKTGKMEKQYEAPILAAIREAKEESGIDIPQLIGPALLRRVMLLTKENPTAADRAEMAGDKDNRVIDGDAGFNSMSYPGVRIKHITAAPIADQVCIGRKGEVLRTQMFGIELADGDILNPKLIGALKNSLPECDKDDRKKEEKKGQVRAEQRVSKLLERHKLFPTRNRLMAWMVQGTMPEQSWNKTAFKDLRLRKDFGSTYDPVFPDFTKKDLEIPGNENGEWFCNLLRKHGIEPGEIDEHGVPLRKDGKPLFHRGEWDKFYYETITPEEHAQVERMAKYIKETVKKVFKGMQQDSAFFKIDTSDTPLNVYQEGADIMPLREYINRSLAEGKENPVYRDVFLGGPLTRGQPFHHGLMYSQLGMSMAIARDDDIDRRFIDSTFGKTTGSAIIGSLQAQRSKFAEQQLPLFKTAIEKDAGAAYQRGRDRAAGLMQPASWSQRAADSKSAERALG